MGDGTINGVQFKDEEYNQVMREEDISREQIRQQGSALVKRLAETYTQLTSLMEQNPELMETLEAEDRARKRAVEDKLAEGLRRANDALRCRWVKQDGTSCKSPQMRNHIYCYAHRQMMEARALALRIPALEDANAIQIALMRVQKSLIDDTISMKKAGLLLYSLQLAMTNVGQTTFGKAGDNELVTNTVDEEEAISNQRSAESQDQDSFTSEDTEKKRGLLRMNTGERGLQGDEIAPVVMRPILTRDLGIPMMGQTHAEMG